MQLGKRLSGKLLPPAIAALRRKFFAMRLVIAIQTNQRRVARIFKEKFQRWRFDVAVAKDHVGVALVAG